MIARTWQPFTGHDSPFFDRRNTSIHFIVLWSVIIHRRNTSIHFIVLWSVIIHWRNMLIHFIVLWSVIIHRSLTNIQDTNFIFIHHIYYIEIQCCTSNRNYPWSQSACLLTCFYHTLGIFISCLTNMINYTSNL